MSSSIFLVRRVCTALREHNTQLFAIRNLGTSSVLYHKKKKQTPSAKDQEQEELLDAAADVAASMKGLEDKAFLDLSDQLSSLEAKVEERVAAKSIITPPEKLKKGQKLPTPELSVHAKKRISLIKEIYTKHKKGTYKQRTDSTIDRLVANISKEGKPGSQKGSKRLEGNVFSPQEDGFKLRRAGAKGAKLDSTAELDNLLSNISLEGHSKEDEDSSVEQEMETQTEKSGASIKSIGNIFRVPIEKRERRPPTHETDSQEADLLGSSKVRGRSGEDRLRPRIWEKRGISVIRSMKDSDGSLKDGDPFHDVEPLNIFNPRKWSPENKAEAIPLLETWVEEYRRQIDEAQILPYNGFEEQIIWTKEGKLWQFPIDNEQGMDEEHSTPFYEHVFLDKHLKAFPETGPVRRFMELVKMGLSKNPHLSVKEKVAHINWYEEYFREKQPLVTTEQLLAESPPVQIEEASEAESSIN